jgi:hypothetical protein
MPEMIYGDHLDSQVDVAVYDYASGARALWNRGARINNYVSRLARSFSELAHQYEEIYIVTHSLGGVIAESATEHYLGGLSRAENKPITPVAALIMFAPPRAGSGWANLIRVMREARSLRVPKEVSRASRFFDTHVESNTICSPNSRTFLVPRYVGIATEDRFVNEFSATHGISERQIEWIAGTHSSIVKPTRENHPQIPWIKSIVDDVGSVRAQWRRENQLALLSHQNEPVRPQRPVVTRLRADAKGAEWEHVYNEARAEMTHTLIPVVDWRSDDVFPVDLLIGVHRADAIAQQATGERVAVEKARRDSLLNERLTVGISAVGPTFAEAESRLHEWLADGEIGSVYAEGVPDSSGLRELMIRWIKMVVYRDPYRPRDTTRIEQRLELTADPYDDLGR